MKQNSKIASKSTKDDLEVPPLTREQLKRGVMGKYRRELMANSNFVRIESDLRNAFPNEQTVNHALRELLKIRETLVSLTSNKTKRRKSA